ncbi:MAG: type IV pilus secretin PilQ [Nevskiaceae bacterium]|nr:MAG: type IV pilus secretin PilQ [Nevskiaceae bacterium]TAM24728.1 MAG: type IV pilus secretin PilQ [Nevskiaceae bacterium]
MTRNDLRYSSQLLVRALLLLVGLALLTLPPLARAQSQRALQSIDFVNLDSDRLLLTLTLSEAAPEPAVFTIDKPARLSLDLADTRLALAERYKKIGIGKARAVAAAEAKGRTRVVVELTDTTAYTVRVEGNKVFLELVTGGGTVASRPDAMVPVAGETGGAINAVDFRRGEKGEGRIVVSLADPRTAVDVKEESGKVVVRFKNARAADKLLRRLDVLDFATPVKFIDVAREGINTVLTVTPVSGADFEQLAYQSGELFTLELQPLTAERIEEKRRNEPLYTGERISLSFQSVDVRSLLQIIADVAGTNMVVSDSVSGEIAMRLQNVPWDQALDIILRTKGLGLRRQGNVMLVAPMGELAEREKSEAEAEKAKVTLSPLRSEIIQINYAKASEIAALLKSGDNSLMTDRGRITVDDRTNTLLLLESREKLAEIRELIGRLDIPVRQVLIESRIVIANDDYSKELGARFGATTVGRNGNNGIVTTTGSAAGTNTIVNDYLNGGFPVNLPGPVGTGTPATDRYNVNLPASANAGRIAFALLGADYLLDLELSALQTEGRGEVMSNPRVITANAKQASIEQGVEIPFQQATSSGATSVSFKKAVLSLKVLPQITPDEKIIMDLEVNNDSRGQDVNTGNGGLAPSIDTRKINTQVLVDNGQTVVLGGIYQQSNRDTVNKIPFLGDLPFLGNAFKFRSNISTKAELLIFITPRIITEGLKVN